VMPKVGGGMPGGCPGDARGDAYSDAWGMHGGGAWGKPLDFKNPF
jgi:hypothetical protein